MTKNDVNSEGSDSSVLGTAEFKVGLFVLVCLGIIAAMSFQVNNNPGATGRVNRYDAILPNATGLVKNATVKMAGIPVGIIKDIQLDNGKARVIMSVKRDLTLGKDATLELKPNGILGDKEIQVTPGSPETAGKLEDGGRITIVIDKGSFDVVLDRVGKIASDISSMTENLKKATTGEGDESSPLGRIIKNIEGLTSDLRDIADNKKEKLEATIDNLHNITKSINEFINDESEDGFKSNWRKMAKSLGRVDDILRNVDEITAKVNTGKGTLGKLINDDTTIEQVNHAVEGVSNMLDTANKFQVSVDYHSEFLGGGFTKSFVGINIQPGPDRYYLVQVIDDPKGFFDRTDTQQVVPGGGTNTTYTSNVYHNRLEFSAEFAKRFYDLTLRAGVIANTGGAGIDYTPIKGLSISAEAFNFSRAEGVDLRVWAKYKFYSIFYAVVGGDDILNKGNNSFTGTAAAGFVGAGVDFTNDDLKLLLTKVPF